MSQGDSKNNSVLILEKLENLEKLLSSSQESPISSHEEQTIDDSFERRMNIFVILMSFLSALLTYGAYTCHPPLFPVFFGLFFIFLILAVGLAIDEYLLPARTFRRISTNAIAISIFCVSIIYLAVSGVQIGTSIISDPFGGEEGRRTPYTTQSEDQVNTGLYGESGQKTQSQKKEAAGTNSTNATAPSSSPTGQGCGRRAKGL